LRAWPWQTSGSAERAALWAPDGLVDTAVRHHRADAFLSGGHDEDPRSAQRWVVGVAPAAELRVDDATTRDDLRRFAFRGPGPAAGFLSYALPSSLTGAGASPRRDPSFPLGLLRRYHALVEWDPPTGELTISADDATLGERLLALLRRSPHGHAPPPTTHTTEPILARGPLRASADRDTYMDGVRETLRAIRAGRVYQLNLSLRFELPFRVADAWPLFRRLFDASPASRYAWVDAGRYKLLSTSPERFLRVVDGAVLTQPIKGTARVPDYADEAAARAALLASPKEAAELSMIVDLLRNDLSRSCVHGSVSVPRHRAVFRVGDLLQAYSDVTGTLRPDRDVVDLLLDAFPGGSVTGCPKGAAMDLIDRLEDRPRDVYCGAFVVIRGPRDMESSIAIRTAVVDTVSPGMTGTLRLDVGSGLVVASDPAAEYAETVAKAERFLRALGVWESARPPSGPRGAP